MTHKVAPLLPSSPPVNLLGSTTNKSQAFITIIVEDYKFHSSLRLVKLGLNIQGSPPPPHPTPHLQSTRGRGGGGISLLPLLLLHKTAIQSEDLTNLKDKNIPSTLRLVKLGLNTQKVATLTLRSVKLGLNTKGIPPPPPPNTYTQVLPLGPNNQHGPTASLRDPNNQHGPTAGLRELLIPKAVCLCKARQASWHACLLSLTYTDPHTNVSPLKPPTAKVQAWAHHSFHLGLRTTY